MVVTFEQLRSGGRRLGRLFESRRSRWGELRCREVRQVADFEKPVVVELGIEFVVELLLFLLPYGAEQMNLPHNFWLGLGCWVFGIAIAIRMFWIFPAWAKRFTRLEKSLISFIFLGLFVLLAYKPVQTDNGNRNGNSSSQPSGTTWPQDSKTPPLLSTSRGHLPFKNIFPNGMITSARTVGHRLGAGRQMGSPYPYRGVGCKPIDNWRRLRRFFRRAKCQGIQRIKRNDRQDW